MTINKVNYKAEPAPADTTPSTAEALDLQKKLNESVQKIEEAEDKYFPQWSGAQKAEVEFKKIKLLDAIAAIEVFLKTGKWVDPTNPAAPTGPQFFDLNTVDSGPYAYDPITGVTAPPPLTATAGDETKVPANSKYMGTISPDNKSIKDPETGEIIPTNLWFIMTSSTDPKKDMTEYSDEVIGTDRVVTITFADQHKESYVIKNGAIRPDVQIGVNALKSEHAVKIDASHAVTINPKTGEKSGTYIIGSRFDDMIIGSWGVDEINAGGGNDIINSGNGADHVYGFASEEVISAFGENTLGVDGNDTIFDAYGTDTVYGGAGGDDKVFRGETTEVKTAAMEVESEETIPTTPGDINSWFQLKGWETSIKNNELALSKTGSGATEITMKLQEEGYMVSGSQEGNDLVLTAVKIADSGEPIYYRIRIENYFNLDTATLNIYNGHIDLSNVNSGTNAVHLFGTAESGDTLIGPKTVFDDYGIKATDLGKSTVTDEMLSERLKTWKEDINADSPWYNATYDQGIITINAGDIKDGTLDIPTDPDEAVFVQIKNGEVIITVVSNTGLQSESVVIKVTGLANPSDLKVTRNGIEGVSGGVYNLGSFAPGVSIDGDAGYDLNAGYQFGTSLNDADSAGVEIQYKPADHAADAVVEAPTAADLTTQINNATSLDELKKIKGSIDKIKDPDEKGDMLDIIDVKAIELINAAIGDMEDLNDAATDSSASAEDKAKAKNDLADEEKEIEGLIAIISNKQDKDDAQQDYDDAKDDLA